MIKNFAHKNNITEKDAKKIFSDIEAFVIDYLLDVKLNEENEISPFKGLKLTSKRVRRKNANNINGESVIVNAHFNDRFKKTINKDPCDDYYSSLWFL